MKRPSGFDPMKVTETVRLMKRQEDFADERREGGGLVLALGFLVNVGPSGFPGKLSSRPFFRRHSIAERTGSLSNVAYNQDRIAHRP
jgi:hypothetical protein